MNEKGRSTLIFNQVVENNKWLHVVVGIPSPSRIDGKSR